MKKHLQLADACRKEDLKTIENLLLEKVNVNAKDSSGLSPLHWAAMWRKYNVVEILLKNRANPDIKIGSGQTAIDLVFGYYESMEGLSKLSSALEKMSIKDNITLTCKKEGESQTIFPMKIHEETIKLFHLLYRYHARDFDVEGVFSTCEKYGIPKVMDFLTKEGYDIKEIRKENREKAKLKEQLDIQREAMLRRVLLRQGYLLEQIGGPDSNPSYRFRYVIRDRKTKRCVMGAKPSDFGLTLDRIEKKFQVK